MQATCFGQSQPPQDSITCTFKLLLERVLCRTLSLQLPAGCLTCLRCCPLLTALYCCPLLTYLQVVLGRNGVESFLPLGPLSEFEQEVRPLLLLPPPLLLLLLLLLWSAADWWC